MTAMRLYILQRVTALVMAPMILVHLAVILYATRRGLSATDVLARTRDSFVWALFYGSFVVAAAVHAAIGIRTVLMEWLRLSNREADLAAGVLGTLLLGLGLRAVVAVVLP